MIRTMLLAAAVFSFAAFAPSPSRAGGDVARGHQLFQLCTQCHGDQGEGNHLALAPQIGGLPEWYVLRQLKGFRAGYRGKHIDDISGMRMRPMALTLESEADVEAVAAYVASLPATPPKHELEGGDAAAGQALYAPCTACHGPDASGMEALGAPPLRHASDWYLLTQLEHFKMGVRGTRPGDVQGALMRPMSMMLADEKAMRDVVAYIAKLSEAQASK